MENKDKFRIKIYKEFLENLRSGYFDKAWLDWLDTVIERATSLKETTK